jgi:excisionase family DNA binding protein
MTETTRVETATISVSHAAKLLGIGRNLAYELARRGEFPGALRLGRRIVVSRKALDAFLEGGRNGQADATRD